MTRNSSYIASVSLREESLGQVSTPPQNSSWTDYWKIPSKYFVMKKITKKPKSFDEKIREMNFWCKYVIFRQNRVKELFQQTTNY